ncbi:MAG: diaminopimelate dehydrogenase [Victivallaceae bacterium]|nr:diaminopimelate dehydrogenase [Victivallaceae bacterium]
MSKIRVVIAGFGNVGRGVRLSLEKQPDMELCGIISRGVERVKKEVRDLPVLPISDAAAWSAQLRPDVVILCGGSKADLPKQGPEICRYANTVDSFDNHSEIPQYFEKLNSAATAAGHVSIMSTGWDPGIFSLERVLAGAFMPGSRAYGFYGLGPSGGLSMGHSDALRTIEGVLDARQYTHAIPEAIERVRRGENPDFSPGDMHTRECFVVLAPGADPAEVTRKIVGMPGYFAPYDTTIHFVTQSELNDHCKGFPHDGLVVASGRTSEGNATLAEYRCVWGSNPEATANVLVAHARAAARLAAEKKRGAFTILDIPATYFSPLSRAELLQHWM